MTLKNRNRENAFVVGVLGATSTDVMFGVKLLQEVGIRVVGLPVSKTPQEQTYLQINKGILLEKVERAIDHLIHQEKVGCVFIYCNSLSALLDVELLEQKFNLPIITPVRFYRKIANDFDRFALIAANGQSIANIERVLITHNPSCTVVGLSNILIVNAIESRIKPKVIIDRYKLLEQSLIFEAAGCERLILGCTHFTYFQAVLVAEIRRVNSQLKVLEPSQQMLTEICQLKSARELSID